MAKKKKKVIKIVKKKTGKKSGKRHTDEEMGIEPESAAGKNWTFGLHKDDKKTMVQIGSRLYELVETDLTTESFRTSPWEDVPHMRRLKPILDRTPDDQAKSNIDSKFFHDAILNPENELSTSGKKNKVTSTKKAIALGKDIPNEVKILLEAKEKAQKAGNEKECRRIRKTLRKLDYKRYTE